MQGYRKRRVSGLVDCGFVVLMGVEGRGRLVRGRFGGELDAGV
jgi:hypothetical protein